MRIIGIKRTSIQSRMVAALPSLSVRNSGAYFAPVSVRRYVGHPQRDHPLQ